MLIIAEESRSNGSKAASKETQQRQQAVAPRKPSASKVSPWLREQKKGPPPCSVRELQFLACTPLGSTHIKAAAAATAMPATRRKATDVAPTINCSGVAACSV